MGYTDVYALAGFFLMLFPVVSWYFIAQSQHDDLRQGTLRVQILSTRTALCLPTYAFLIWVSLLAPELAPIMEVPIAIAEGFTLYSFFGMLVANCGGADNTLQEMTSANRTSCCCCPDSKNLFYNKVKRALWQFLFIRPVVILVAVIFEYSHVQILYLLFMIVALVQFGYGFGSIVLFCKFLSHSISFIFLS